MKHLYAGCPHNPNGHSLWRPGAVDCPGCLQKLILWYEQEYQMDPERAVYWLNQDLK